MPPITRTVTRISDVSIVGATRDVTVSHEADLTILYKNPYKPENDCSFRVSRASLTEKSRYFRALLDSRGAWQESGDDTITLVGDEPGSLKVWLILLHGQSPNLNPNVSARDIMSIFSVADKYQFPIGLIRVWYVEWYRRLGQTLRPTETIHTVFACRDPNAFAHVTGELVYQHRGIIKEPVAEEFEHLRLPESVVEALNQVQKHIHDTLLRQLSDLHSSIVRHHNPETRQTAAVLLYDQLSKMPEFTPMERVKNRPLYTVLNALKDLKFEDQRNKLPIRLCERYSARERYRRHCCHCLGCDKFYYAEEVHWMGKSLLELFDGLCLDCMEKERTGAGFEDGGLPDSGCRIKHGRITRIFSRVAGSGMGASAL